MIRDISGNYLTLLGGGILNIRKPSLSSIDNLSIIRVSPIRISELLSSASQWAASKILKSGRYMAKRAGMLLISASRKSLMSAKGMDDAYAMLLKLCRPLVSEQAAGDQRKI